jgi:putative chitinase
MLTLSELSAVMPRAGSFASLYLEPLNATFEEFAIDNPDRQAAFLAQISVESQELRKVEEDLHYSVTRLLVVWPSRFRTTDEALPYAYQPEKLANFIYANKYGNGNEASGDGWRYRGAGLIGITFEANHAACASHFKMPLDQIGDWLRTPEGAARSAGWFWWSRSLNALADHKSFTLITRRINPALAGMNERLRYWARAQEVLA